MRPRETPAPSDGHTQPGLLEHEGVTLKFRNHILLTTDAVGGVWSYSLELARALERWGVRVELAVLGPAPNEDQRASANQLHGVTLHVTECALDWTADSPKALAQSSAQLAELAASCVVDLVQLHTPALASQSPFSVPLVAVMHSCVGTWWEAVRGGALPPELAWRANAVAAGLRAADAVVAPSQAFADLVRQVYGPMTQMRVVHNGRTGPEAHSSGRPSSSRNGVLAIGRLWDEGKNISFLDRVAGRLRHVPFLAAGALCAPGGGSAVLNTIKHLGILNDAGIAKAMDAARIFASSALYEPFGLTVLEAAQAKLPLILSDIPTFRELWGDAAVFLPPRDEDAWARTLTELHARPEECRRLGEKAHAKASHYTTDGCARAMRHLHAVLLSGRTLTAPAGSSSQRRSPSAGRQVLRDNRSGSRAAAHSSDRPRD
jgi:glycogen synthase